MLNKYLILILTFSSLISFSYAQEKEKKKLVFGVELNSQMSYSGISSGVQMNVLHKKHSLGIGAKVTYQSSFFPYQNALGIIVDYKLFLISKDNMKAFVELNYNNSIYKSLRRDADKNNIIHEYTYSNGILIKVVENLWIGNSMGIGAYTEKYYDYSEEKYGSYLGYNVMFKVTANYEF
jgi:hypothetical protein